MENRGKMHTVRLQNFGTANTCDATCGNTKDASEKYICTRKHHQNYYKCLHNEKYVQMLRSMKMLDKKRTDYDENVNEL